MLFPINPNIAETVSNGSSTWFWTGYAWEMSKMQVMSPITTIYEVTEPEVLPGSIMPALVTVDELIDSTPLPNMSTLSGFTLVNYV